MDNTKKINPYTHEPKKGVSWRAIIAGTFMVLTILLVLNLIELAIGLVTIEPTEETNLLSGIGTEAFNTLFSAWLLTTVVGTIISDVESAVGGVISTTGEFAGDSLAPAIVKKVEELDKSLDGAKSRGLGIKSVQT